MATVAEKTYIVGLYDDDHHLVEAVHTLRGRGIKIKDVFTPFPVHHLDTALGYKASSLPDAAFVFGALGTTLALLMQTGMYTFDWPVNVGGKPGFPLPSFMPITFEVTVLLASFGMVGCYLYANGLYPGKKPVIVDPRQTDDRFVVVVEKPEDASQAQLIEQTFRATHIVEVREQNLALE